jgi:hypothetical protein
MGGINSTSNAKTVAKAISSIAPAYEEYSKRVLDNGINGSIFLIEFFLFYLQYFSQLRLFWILERRKKFLMD